MKNKIKQEQKPFINYMYINVSETYFKVDLNGSKSKKQKKNNKHSS